jgi:hypothetical protein
MPDPINLEAMNIRQLLDRLERISADSPWAHQASGIRASLSRLLASPKPDLEAIRQLMDQGYRVVEGAAREIPEEGR